jgi:hypothetical protein
LQRVAGPLWQEMTAQTPKLCPEPCPDSARRFPAKIEIFPPQSFCHLSDGVTRPPEARFERCFRPCARQEALSFRGRGLCPGPGIVSGIERLGRHCIVCARQRVVPPRRTVPIPATTLPGRS